MTVKEISDLIVGNEYDFQVTVSGSKFVHKITKIETALADSESIENYLLKIAKYNNAKELIVKLSIPRGTSATTIDIYSISIPNILAVATVNEAVATVNSKPVATANNIAVAMGNLPINGLKELQNNTKTTTMQDKEYIDFKVLEVKHDQLNGFYNEAKDKIVKLDKKVDELNEENKNLLRDITTKNDKHELALERVKMDMEKEGKDGLSGVMDFANNNPETVKMLLGALFPNNPNFKQIPEQNVLEGAIDENREIKYTDDAEANFVLNDIPRSLSQKNGDTIAQIYLLFKKFTQTPEILAQAVSTFLPEYKA